MGQKTVPVFGNAGTVFLFNKYIYDTFSYKWHINVIFDTFTLNISNIIAFRKHYVLFGTYFAIQHQANN